MTNPEKLEIMKQYLLMKFYEEDWHGVMDAAADIREIVVAMKVQKNPTSKPCLHHCSCFHDAEELCCNCKARAVV